MIPSPAGLNTEEEFRTVPAVCSSVFPDDRMVALLYLKPIYNMD